MASVPPSYPSLPSPQPTSDFPENSSPNNSFLPFSNNSVVEQHPATIQNSVLASSSRPSAFSVETRICPAKHGIAVSLCLVDSRTAPSSLLVTVKGTEREHKPIGWVSPNTWDSRFTGTNPNTAPKPNGDSDTVDGNESESKSVIVSENTTHDKGQNRKAHDMSSHDRTANSVASGDYIDILQAKMLFGNQSLTQEKSKMQAETQRNPHHQSLTATQVPLCTQSPPHVELVTKSHSPSRSRTSGEAGLFLAHQHSQTQHCDSLEPPQCVRTVRFAEKPCTPCMTRRQGGNITRAQELRCRYRDSYQAAIQNPVTFAKDKNREDMLAVVDEGGDLSRCVDRLGSQGTETGDPKRDIQDTWCDPGLRNQSPPSVTVDVCKESGEINTVPQKLPEHSNTSPCLDHRGVNPLQFMERQDQTTEKTSTLFGDAQSAKSYRHLPKVSTNPKISTTNVLSGTNGPKHLDVSIKHHGSSFSSSEMSNMSRHNGTGLAGKPLNLKPPTVSLNGQDSQSDRRCSSLSTTVVDTSEKCQLVIVEGQNVRRKESSISYAEIPQLHVVKCKNSTAFGLVSPKINRRKKSTTVGEQPTVASTTSGTRDQTETMSHIETLKVSRPRPDHLPLGSPDPTAHPVYLGLASLTGCRDKTGRAIVELYGDHQGWQSTVTSQELFQMLLYFYSLIRKEVRDSGMTLIFDARRKNPQPQLYKALMTCQEQCSCAVSSLVLLVDKESRHRPERCPGIQVSCSTCQHVSIFCKGKLVISLVPVVLTCIMPMQTDSVTSMKALLKLVEVNQLSTRLGGSSHGHRDWMELHQRLFPFVNDLHEASSLLLRAISKLEEPQIADTVQAVQQCMMDQRTLMRDVLGDNRLVSLQREGGAILARLRKESDLKYPHCDDLSNALDSVTSLYNYVEEQAHVLVQRTNVSLEHLEYLLQLLEMKGHFIQIHQWFSAEGECHLQEAESVETSGDRMEQVLNSFTGFLIEANDRRHHALSLVSEAERLQQRGLSYPETETFRAFLCTFKSKLEDFLCRAEACGRELQLMVNVCDFCEQAMELASACTDYLNQCLPRIQSVQDPESVSDPQQQNKNLLFQSDASHVSGPTSGPPLSPDRLILQSFQEKFLQFSPEKFQEMKVQASALRSYRGMQVWNIAHPRCQEAQQLLQERMQDLDRVYSQQADLSSCSAGHFVDVVSTNVQTAPPGGQKLVVQSTSGVHHPQWESNMQGAVDLGKRKPFLDGNNPHSTTVACCNSIIKPENNSDNGPSQGSKVTPESPHRSSRKTEREARRRQTSRARSERDTAALSQSHTVGCQWFPWRRTPGARSVSQDSCVSRVPAADPSPPEQQGRPLSPCSHRGQPSCRILQEAQKFQISRHGSFCSEDSCLSNRGAAGDDGTVCGKHASLPAGRYGGAFCLSGPQANISSSLRLQHVMEELVFTEREYVRSLAYILTHYLPLMDRLDIPQDLRGKRGVIFGNLEKLHDFHSHYFLPELEACERQPSAVARCFLRHSESFGLYALYSKNKPQSDALILHRRHDIFKKKQQELGDMMDLSSYLLRPIQRISKYSLLLQDMLALVSSRRPKAPPGVCGLAAHASDLTCTETDRESADIQTAADLIQFQMRHGNDLLTMDAIQDCDVNLKEQGQLIRQDEFTVFFRKKKCVRRIFLFEHLVLFSKSKRTDVGNDVYVYKQSFKTSDIGMTHNSGMGSLCFEIWFRRRKSEDTYTLKASGIEVKQAWTTDLERILWDQAAHSRELRLQERVFMGMGYKPFMDIQPSDAAICDRAVGCVHPGRVPVACCSHRGLEYPRPRSIGSGSTASTTLSQSSSSSGRGSLPPAGYPGNLSHGMDANPAVCVSTEAMADNELNSHRPHQHHPLPHCDQWSTHCPLMNSTESPGVNPNLFNRSDSCCLSALSGEVVDDSSVASRGSERKPPLCRTPSLRKNGSSAASGKKPVVPPKPPHLDTTQGKLGKSTEV
uniref:Pleckstrin homology domain containing, family G (With RhoGef domain) member 4 n=2 Tax=Nothobranchius furzeri TaxID=105023 RepID=A0A8C6PT95_NOTFU